MGSKVGEFNSMKITVECDCGNKIVIKPVTMGNVAYFSQNLRDHDFDLNSVEIETSLESDTITDPDDVSTKLMEFRIDCKKCGEYIILDCNC